MLERQPRPNALRCSGRGLAVGTAWDGRRPCCLRRSCTDQQNHRSLLESPRFPCVLGRGKKGYSGGGAGGGCSHDIFSCRSLVLCISIIITITIFVFRAVAGDMLGSQGHDFLLLTAAASWSINSGSCLTPFRNISFSSSFCFFLCPWLFLLFFFSFFFQTLIARVTSLRSNWYKLGNQFNYITKTTIYPSNHPTKCPLNHSINQYDRRRTHWGQGTTLLIALSLATTVHTTPSLSCTQ